MADEALIVDLNEFAELCGVTGETMRVHLRELGKDGAAATAWLIERGDRGRPYRIDAEGGLGWWKAARDAEDLADAERQGRLQLLRRELVGGGAEDEDQLALSGKARREEYLAAEAAIKYRRALGQLVEKTRVERVIGAAVVVLRRQLQQIAPEFGIAAGLPAGQVKDLASRIERAAGDFADEVGKPGAFAEE